MGASQGISGERIWLDVGGAGQRGPITKTLQSAFFDVVAGRERKYERWLSYV